MAKTFKKIEIWCFTVPSATVHSQLATRVPHLGLCSPVGPWAFMLKNPEPWLLGNTHPGGPKAPKLPNFPGATISHHPTGETIKRLICLFWRPVYTAFFFFFKPAMSTHPGWSSDNHLQLLGILHDLFGHLSGEDGGVFWLLLLAGREL